MIVKCGDCVQINLSHPVFRRVIVSQRSKTILALGDGFCMKFYFHRKDGDTYYGDFVETVSLNEERSLDRVLKEVMQ